MTRTRTKRIRRTMRTSRTTRTRRRRTMMRKRQLLNIADINAFAFSLLKLSNLLIFQIVKYAKVTKVSC